LVTDTLIATAITDAIARHHRIIRASIPSLKVIECSRTADTCAATTATRKKASTECVSRSTEYSSKFAGAMAGRRIDPNTTTGLPLAETIVQPTKG
jgi:hypothetical protein